jgi:hypothetical protein
MTNHKMILLKPYSLKELAEIYEIDWRTFKKWLIPFEEEIGKKEGRYYKIPQVRVIFRKLELPSPIDLDSSMAV